MFKLCKDSACPAVLILLGFLFPPPEALALDVSGIYSSTISGTRTTTVSRKTRSPEVVLEQVGDKVTGSYGDGAGEITGKVVGNRIKFEWKAFPSGGGFGSWLIKPETNELVGDWQSGHTGSGKWNLKAINPVDFSRQPASVKSPSQTGSDVIEISSGSGFAVSASGHIVTNNHVVRSCARVDLRYQGKSVPTTPIYNDPINDLAILKADFEPAAVFGISRRNPSILQEIYVAGYPFGDAVSSSIKVTKGIVSSLAGLGNNISRIQIDAALQPGSSGGPIFDEKGNVVGVAVAKLDLRKVIENYGMIPENTNFGIKSSVVVNLLESNGIEIVEPSSDAISKSELGTLMTSATYHLTCWMTRKQIRQMAKSKIMFGDNQ